LRIDHWLRAVGWLDLGLFVAAALLWLTRAANRAVPKAAD
jgi:hypothetical protein